MLLNFILETPLLELKKNISPILFLSLLPWVVPNKNIFLDVDCKPSDRETYQTQIICKYLKNLKNLSLEINLKKLKYLKDMNLSMLDTYTRIHATYYT